VPICSLDMLTWIFDNRRGYSYRLEIFLTGRSACVHNNRHQLEECYSAIRNRIPDAKGAHALLHSRGIDAFNRSDLFRSGIARHAVRQSY
jgi:hypothetical protein